MLQYGAERVYAVDVGHGQLAEPLRQDARVICMEGTDIRTLQREAVPDCIDFLSVDVSFISLERILPDICRFLSENGTAVLLIKPQFEAGRTDVGKNGIVRSKAVHVRVLQTVCMALERYGLHIQMLCPSPIRGGSGNAEYLVLVKRGKEIQSVPFSLQFIVAQALAADKK